jgi:hypothetical protein
MRDPRWISDENWSLLPDTSDADSEHSRFSTVLSSCLILAVVSSQERHKSKQRVPLLRPGRVEFHHVKAGVACQLQDF